MQENKGVTGLRGHTLALIGTLVLPLGGLSWFFALVGGFSLFYGITKLLEGTGLNHLKGRFGTGLMLAIAGGLWAKHTLENQGFDTFRLLITSLVSGIGLYMQSSVYSALAHVENKELLELGGILLVIGASTFWFYVGFIPLAVGVLLLAYSFWRWS